MKEQAVNYIFVVTIVITAFFLSAHSIHAASFQGLGDLTGGAVLSRAYGTSNDGSIVGGESNSSSGLEAFRWTPGGGMVGLGDLAGGSFLAE